MVIEVGGGMGFNGEIVVVRRGEKPSNCGSFIGIKEHEFCAEWPLKDGWLAIHVSPHDEPYKYDSEWMAEIATKTGAPVLACWVFESDVAHIRGMSDAGTWDAWLNRPYASYMLVQEVLEEIAEDLYEDGGQEEIDRYLAQHCEETLARLEGEISAASRKAAEWAAQAGYVVPTEPIEELLTAPRELFIQWGFFKLLYRLGLREADFVPNACAF